MDSHHKSRSPRQLSARAVRRAAALFNYGNLIAIALPLPLGIFWLGASMVVYALNRHHPDARVGHYTQWAAYRFYGLVGLVVVVATFYGTGLKAWLITWGVLAVILVPWTIYDLIKIHREPWRDITLTAEEEA